MNRYKEPLVWIDLEMTGLNIETDTILEIASIVTDNNLNIIAYGPTLVIKHTKEQLKQMDEWNTKHHGLSGLTQKAIDSIITLENATDTTFKFLKEYTQKNGSPLCGNSVWQDRLFLKKYMPEIEQYLNYRIIDVSSIKEVIHRWYPTNKERKFIKPQNHRAHEDICYSIEELKYYQKMFFNSNILDYPITKIF